MELPNEQQDDGQSQFSNFEPVLNEARQYINEAISQAEQAKSAADTAKQRLDELEAEYGYVAAMLDALTQLSYGNWPKTVPKMDGVWRRLANIHKITYEQAQEVTEQASDIRERTLKNAPGLTEEETRAMLQKVQAVQDELEQNLPNDGSSDTSTQPE